jgi:glycosyltransferase involved in cell wall biosynthesis
VLAVGRQEFQKGQIFLIEAIAELRQQRKHLRLLIAGREGNATSQLKVATQRLGLGNHVSLLGHRTDIGDLLAAADVFCFPSVYEGFGGAAIEAMAVGTPIVASDLPALREVMGDTAIFVPSQSAQALARGIRDLLEKPSLGRSLASAAKVRVTQRYSLDHIAGEMAGLYREVAGHGRRSA